VRRVFAKGCNGREDGDINGGEGELG